MKRTENRMIYVFILFLMLCSSCSSPRSEHGNKLNPTKEEHLDPERFFRYFMLHETAVYTLSGSKPMTEMILFYKTKPEEILREEERENRVYFLLNRNKEKDMEFYRKLSSSEKEEKAYLISQKDFIYDIEYLWGQWEKIRHRFPVKKQFLLVKKEWPNSWKELFPGCKAAYDVFLVDVMKTALVIQENYELFKRAVGYDFDPLEIVFEPENENSVFWNTLRGENAWRYTTLWGLLYGFGKENSFCYTWNRRHMKEPHRTEKEKLWGSTVRKEGSSKIRPSFDDKDAFTLSNFPIPIFKSFVDNDPVVAKYEAEKERIKKLYKGKDFVIRTLELLTDLPDPGKE